jgi:hypothetical protein
MANFDVAFDDGKWQNFLVRAPRILSVEEVPVALRRLVLDGLNRFIRRTPVNTGRARGGWLPYAEDHGLPVSIGNTVGGDGVAIGRKEGSYEEQGGDDAFVLIINRVPYIVFLEYGSSRQATHGMVRISMAELSGQKVAGLTFNSAWRKAARKAGAR